MKIGERIMEKRIENNMTMKDLGDRLGVSAAAVNKWEKGIVSNIGIETLSHIANALDCDLKYLIDDSIETMTIERMENNMLNYDEKTLKRLITYAEYLILRMEKSDENREANKKLIQSAKEYKR
jgi:transcriptional regulator with XRE-family HTH domain